MTCRECLDGLQRAGHSGRLTYNAAEQETISLRSIRMRGIEATGSFVRFERVEDGGLPCLQR